MLYPYITISYTLYHVIAITYWLLSIPTVLLPSVWCPGKRTCVEYIPFHVPWGYHLMSLVTIVTYWLLGRHDVTHAYHFTFIARPHVLRIWNKVLNTISIKHLINIPKWLCWILSNCQFKMMNMGYHQAHRLKYFCYIVTWVYLMYFNM